MGGAPSIPPDAEPLGRGRRVRSKKHLSDQFSYLSDSGVPLDPSDGDEWFDDDALLLLAFRSQDFKIASALFSLAETAGSKVVVTLSAAKKRPDWPDFKEAIKKELRSLQEKGTWILTPRSEVPKGRRVLYGKWVLCIKAGGLYKARWVACGYSQQEGKDYDETFAPVCRIDSLKLLFAVCVAIAWVVHHVDVSTAFLNGSLEHLIFVHQPSEFEEEGKEDWVCRLLRSLYGLRQSPRQWNKKVHPFIESMGFVRCDCDGCVYVMKDGNGVPLAILLLFVDDFFLGASSDLVLMKSIKAKILAEYDCKDLGLVQRALGLQCEWSESLDSVKIHQKHLVTELVHNTNMAGCKKAMTPGVDRLSKSMGPRDEAERLHMRAVPYRRTIGVLIYLLLTRIDIYFAVMNAAQFCSDPGRSHWKAVQRIIRYLSWTRDRGITYSAGSSPSMSDVVLVGYSDADYNGCLDSLRSTTGYVNIVAGGPVSFVSKIQRTPSHSSTESELVAVDEEIREVIYLRTLLCELGFEQVRPTVIYEDNNAVICLSKTCAYHRSVKHLALRKAFVNQMVNEGVVELQRVDTADQLADILTKNCSQPVYERLLPYLTGLQKIACDSVSVTPYIGLCGSEVAARIF